MAVEYGMVIVKPCDSPRFGQLPFHVANAPLNLLTLFFFLLETFLVDVKGKKGRGIKATVKLIK